VIKVNQLKAIERNDQRVLTSEQLAESYGTDIGKIRYNYSYNKSRYTEGKHFFALKGEERSNFLNECEIHTSLKHAHTIYLWTEKGAFLHAKSLSTDKAWNAYSQLVDDYFKKVEEAKQPQPDMTGLSPQLQFMIQTEQRQNALEAKQTEFDEKAKLLEHRINMMDKTNIKGDEQQIFNKMIRKYAGINGMEFQKAWREFKGFYNVAYHRNITSLHENYMLKVGKKVTLPEYLVATGQIEDALRVADKMLNNAI
jgi:hypothetical protein